jgi:peptidoglycan hydrolase-like protein with peptidoglycan-binding domain
VTGTLRVALALAAACAVACQTRHVQREREQQEKPSQEDGRGGPEVKAGPARPPVPAAPQTLLAEGAARRIQEALARRGYLEAPRSDALDDATAGALRRFQREEGLAATGFPDRETVRRLGIDPTEVYRDASSSAGDGENVR